MGVVIARTGRLSKSGDPLAFAMSRVEPELRRVKNGGPSHEVRLASRDSRSCADGTREAVREPVRDEGARIVLTLAGTEVLPAVADTCEEEGVPCVSGTFPWQVYYHGRGGTAVLLDLPLLPGPGRHRRDLRGPVGGGRRLGTDGRLPVERRTSGDWSRHAEHGFPPVVRARGHHLLDPSRARPGHGGRSRAARPSATRNGTARSSVPRRRRRTLSPPEVVRANGPGRGCRSAGKMMGLVRAQPYALPEPREHGAARR